MLSVLTLGLLMAGQASALSCASDEPPTPQVPVEHLAQILAAVAREQALAGNEQDIDIF